MLDFLLPFAKKIVESAVNRIPNNAELGKQLIDICLIVIKKAVDLTDTDMDDQLFHTVEKAIRTRHQLEESI